MNCYAGLAATSMAEAEGPNGTSETSHHQNCDVSSRECPGPPPLPPHLPRQRIDCYLVEEDLDGGGPPKAGQHGVCHLLREDLVEGGPHEVGQCIGCRLGQEDLVEGGPHQAKQQQVMGVVQAILLVPLVTQDPRRKECH